MNEVSNIKKDTKIEKSNELMFLNIQEAVTTTQATMFSLALKNVGKVYNKEKKRENYISTFTKREFCESMGYDEKQSRNYNTRHIARDVDQLRIIGLMKVSNEKTEKEMIEKKITSLSLFGAVEYYKGVFTCYWNDINFGEDFPIERILAEKENVIGYPMELVAGMKPSSLLLYEYIRNVKNSGEKTIILDMEALITIFKLNNRPRKGYVKRKENYEMRYIKRDELNPAIEEINNLSPDLTVKCNDVKSGKKVVAVELVWFNKDKSLEPTVKQISTAKQVEFEMEVMETYFADDKEYTTLHQQLKEWESYDRFEFGVILQKAITKKNEAKKEYKLSGIENIDKETFNLYQLILQGRKFGTPPTLSEKAKFIELFEHFNNVNKEQSPAIINLAFSIFEKKEGERLSYVNKILNGWKDNEVSSKYEAEQIYDSKFGGFEEKEKELRENVKVSDEFLGAMNLWSE